MPSDPNSTDVVFVARNLAANSLATPPSPELRRRAEDRRSRVRRQQHWTWVAAAVRHRSNRVAARRHAAATHVAARAAWTMPRSRAAAVAGASCARSATRGAGVRKVGCVGAGVGAAATVSRRGAGVAAAKRTVAGGFGAGIAPGVMSNAAAGLDAAGFGGASSFRGASALHWRRGGVFAKTSTVGDAARALGDARFFLRADVSRANAPNFLAAASASRDASKRWARRAAKAHATRSGGVAAGSRHAA